MEENLGNAKNYHQHVNDLYLSISDDEISSNSLLGVPKRFYHFKEYPRDNNAISNKFSKLLEKKKKPKSLSFLEANDMNPKKETSSQKNSAQKTFYTRKKAGGLKHLTVVIPEDENLLKKDLYPSKKPKKAYWEIIWEILLLNERKKEKLKKKHRIIRSQSFDEYLCFSEKFIHYNSYFYILRKMKGKVCKNLFLFSYKITKL